MTVYDAFISYSHAKDKPIAAALQSVVQKLGKPWYRRRSLRAFRDDTSLSATPHLWPSIEQALAQSRYFILLASPDAAASRWVNKEVAYWLEHNSIDTLLIALTDGELGWNDARGDFEWREGMPLPPVLAGRFPTEPKWVDLRNYRDGAHAGDVRFIELGADFAATIRGMPKEDLLSQEVRQQRRALTLAWSAVSSLLILIGIALWQWSAAVEQKDIAQVQRDRAVEAERTAQQQRDRAEKTLAAATKTANDLVSELAQQFRDQSGMPTSLTNRILTRARDFQKQLADAGESTPELRQAEAGALSELVITLLEQGDAQGALAAAERTRDVYEDLAANSPEVRWQRGLAIAHSRVGDALRALGRRAEALGAYRKGLPISENLAAANPDDVDLHSGLAIFHQRIGDVLRDGGEREEALATFRKALAVLEKFGESTSDLRWSLAVAHDKIGSVLALSGRHAEALESFRADLELMKKVVPAFPADARALRDLAIAYQRVGGALTQLGRTDEAIEALQAGVRIANQVVAASPDNTQLQSMLASSYEMYYRGLRATGRTADAKEALDKLVALREKAATTDPGNTLWQHRLALGYALRADRLLDDEEGEKALEEYRKALAIQKKLTVIDARNIDWRNDLAAILGRIATVLSEAGQLGEALDYRLQDLRISQQVAAEDHLNPVSRRNLRDSTLNAGRTLFALARTEESLGYFDEAARLAESVAADQRGKDTAEGHWWRSLARLSLNQQADALEDMRLAVALDPENAHYAIGLHMMRARNGQDDAEELKANSARADRGKWPWPLIAFYLGQSDMEGVLAAAAREKSSPLQQPTCDADAFLGAHLSETGARAEARRLLQSAVDGCRKHLSSRMIAAGFLNRLDESLQARGPGAITVAQCNGLAASGVDPERPASVPAVAYDEINPPAAIAACEAAVKVAPDDRRIVFQLGRAYDAAKDYAKAQAFYHRAHELGHALATNNLATLYDGGRVPAPDPGEARRLFQHAARAEIPLAMFNLGRMYDHGRGGPKDYAQARHWYEQAAGKGFAHAAYRIGLLHYYGSGVPRNSSEALRWYMRAAGGGDAGAMRDVGYCYERGDGVAVDYGLAHSWYEKAAAAGDNLAMSNLGVLYSRGAGVTQDFAMARQWYERAAAAGSPAGMWNLGIALEMGRGAAVDYNAARGWYEKAATANFAPSMVSLGLLYERGLGTERDLAEAQRWLERAVAAGYEPAASHLARVKQSVAGAKQRADGKN